MFALGGNLDSMELALVLSAAWLIFGLRVSRASVDALASLLEERAAARRN